MPSSAVAAPSVAASTEKSLSGVLVLLGLALGALWLVCCRQLSAEWSYNEQYNYGWFVPFFALYLFWLRWEDRPPRSVAEIPNSKLQSPISRSAVAFGAGILLFLIFPIRLIEIANPDWRPLSWAHALVVVGLTLLLLWRLGGFPWLRHFAFPVVFFLIAVPWPSGIEQPLIQGLMPTVATIATETLSLFGIPAEVQGNLIHINGGVVGVNEACSGVRSLQTSVMVGLLFGELNRLNLGRRIALILAAVFIAFVANCGRAFFLVWIASNRGVAEVEHWHDIAGYAIVGLVFVGCLGLTKWFSRGHKRAAPTPQSAIRPDRRGSDSLTSGDQTRPSSARERNSQSAISLLPSPAFVAGVLVWLLAVELGVEAWYRSHERDLRPSLRWNVRWPENAPQFRELKIDERTKSLLHEDEGRGALWNAAANEASPNVGATPTTALLYFFRWYPGHNSALLANAHRPDVCLPASGWRQTNDFGVKGYAAAPGLSIPFRHFEFVTDAGGRTRYAHAFYCIWEDRVPKENVNSGGPNMSTTPSAWDRRERIQAVIDGRRHLGQQVMEYLMVQAEPAPPEQAEAQFSAELPELITPPTKPL